MCLYELMHHSDSISDGGADVRLTGVQSSLHYITLHY